LVQTQNRDESQRNFLAKKLRFLWNNPEKSYGDFRQWNFFLDGTFPEIKRGKLQRADNSDWRKT